MTTPTASSSEAQPTKTPRTQYIFIDYENVCEADLSRIAGKPAKVFMVLGVRHNELPVSLFLFAQNHPEQLRIIQTPVGGRNALDFVLTFELGRVMGTDPNGYFHIISKDTDFNSVIRHLESENKLIARRTSLAEIPALRSQEERIARLKAKLKDIKKPRPSTRKKLENEIKSVLENNTDQNVVEQTIDTFVQEDILSFTETDKVAYKAA